MMWPAKVTRSCLIGLMRCVMYIACCMMDGVRGKNVAFNMKSVRFFYIYIHCESKILCNNCVKCEAILVVPSLLYSVMFCALGLDCENTFTTFTVLSTYLVNFGTFDVIASLATKYQKFSLPESKDSQCQLS